MEEVKGQEAIELGQLNKFYQKSDQRAKKLDKKVSANSFFLINVFHRTRDLRSSLKDGSSNGESRSKKRSFTGSSELMLAPKLERTGSSLTATTFSQLAS